MPSSPMRRFGVAWTVMSQAGPGATALRDEIAAGTPFFVPPIWPFEVANALLMLVRRKRLMPAEFARGQVDQDKNAALTRHTLARLRPTPE